MRKDINKNKKDFVEVQTADNDNSEENYIPPPNSSKNKLHISRFVAELDRYRVSDGAGAALATALLEDIG